MAMTDQGFPANSGPNHTQQNRDVWNEETCERLRDSRSLKHDVIFSNPPEISIRIL